MAQVAPANALLESLKREAVSAHDAADLMRRPCAWRGSMHPCR